MPPRQLLDLAEVHAKLAAVLDKPRSSRPVEEEFGVDPGVATAETECTHVLHGGGRGPATLVATDTRVKEDAMTLPAESWSWQRASPSSFWSFPNSAKCHRDGRRSPRRGQNRRTRTAARDVVPDLWDTRICSEGQWPRPGVGVGRCSDRPTPTPDQTSTGHPPKPQQLSLGTGKQPH